MSTIRPRPVAFDRIDSRERVAVVLGGEAPWFDGDRSTPELLEQVFPFPGGVCVVERQSRRAPGSRRLRVAVVLEDGMVILQKKRYHSAHGALYAAQREAERRSDEHGSDNHPGP